MPISVDWGNADKTYTVFTFQGKWTWEEYHAAIEKGVDMVSDKPYVVNILIDMLDCNLFPNNMLSHFNTSMRQPPKKFDLAIVVSTSGFIQAIANIIGLFPTSKNTQFKVVKTLEEGHRLLQQKMPEKA